VIMIVYLIYCQITVAKLSANPALNTDARHAPRAG